ncbi:geranylgeranyl transferase type-1 subunit beta-like [Convolutriloba macropyga]|uniref:geranylgeranyl transferase type-1 subunit beta-like n=1 Tax=Convolutriloba macropyga TaxID=536237 RepID=UPI003F5289E1
MPPDCEDKLTASGDDSKNDTQGADGVEDCHTSVSISGDLSDSFQSDARFMAYFLTMWPDRMSTLENQKMVIVFFAISTCASLNLLPVCHKAAGGRDSLIEWIYSHQLHGAKSEDDEEDYGFRASCWLVPSRTNEDSPNELHQEKTIAQPSSGIKNSYDSSHLTMTHVALLSLICLEDDLSRIEKEGILRHVARLQTDAGSFSCIRLDGEEDIRFMYAAVSICYILNDFSQIDVEAAVKYILSCLSPVGGAFSQKPGGEAHGGCTYLALASLKLLGKLDTSLSEKDRNQLIQWLVGRQSHGFNGRPAKDSDTCYFFWVGASLSILGCYDLIDHQNARVFASTCRGPCGGYCKLPSNSDADPLHSHCVISALALDPKANEISSDEMLTLSDILDIPEKYHSHLKKVHSTWSS